MSDKGMGLLGEVIATLLRPLLRAFFMTATGMFVLNVALMIIVYKVVAEGGASGKAFVATLLVMVLGAILGMMLSVKRAVLAAVREGARSQRLGQRTLDALFSRVLGVKDGAKSTGIVGSAAEKIPLGRAEQLAKDAAAGLISEGANSGFFRSRLHRLIVGRIEALTLSRFRAENDAAGGVDLVKVRDELANTVEEKLLGLIDGMMLKLTLLLCLGLTAGAIAIAVIFKRV